jgi:hypothetical protein
MAYLFIQLREGTSWHVYDDLKAKIIEQGLDLSNESDAKMDTEKDINPFILLKEVTSYDSTKFCPICCYRSAGPGWSSYLFESTFGQFGSSRANHFLLEIEDDALAVQIKLACF